MRTLILILLVLFVCPNAFAGAHLKELHNKHSHAKKMRQAGHQACKAQNGGHTILHHHKK
jgi:hypothetical protein